MEEEKKDAPQEAPAPEAAPSAKAIAAVKGAKGKLVKPEDVKSGMTIRIHEKIKDVTSKGEERERMQVFEGMVLSVRGAGRSKSMTVRKQSGPWSVEKIFPIFSPIIDRIEVVKIAKVRRAKLTYLSDKKKGFKRRLKETRVE